MAEIHFDIFDYIEEVTDSELIQELKDRDLAHKIKGGELEDILIILRSGDNDKLRVHLEALIYDRIGRIV